MRPPSCKICHFTKRAVRGVYVCRTCDATKCPVCGRSSAHLVSTCASCGATLQAYQPKKEKP